MNHTFQFGNEPDKTKCKTCQRPMLSHSILTPCESCGKIEKCDWYEKVNKVLCLVCRGNETEKVLVVLREKQEENRVAGLINGENVADRDIHNVQTQIRYNGDVFNAKMVAIVELKSLINADESIPATEKESEFQRALAARRAHLKDVAFKTNAEIDSLKETLKDTNLGVIAIDTTLRGLGEAYRKEIQEEIKKQDSLYVPIPPKTQPKVRLAKKKTSPDEVMVERLMGAKPQLKRWEAVRLLKEQGLISKECPEAEVG